MAKKNRRFSVFSLSFLDIMSCGFGAVILIFLVMNHATDKEIKITNADKLSEIRRLDYLVQESTKNLFNKTVQLKDVTDSINSSSRELQTKQAEVNKNSEDLISLADFSVNQTLNIERLKSDVNTRENELAELRSNVDQKLGGKALQFSGDGDRQYLTGLKVGGKHIVIAVDISASMLDSTIVNVLRRRNMTKDKKQKAPKWQRTIRTVEWLAAQMPLDGNFQIIGFNDKADSLSSDSSFSWIPVDNSKSLDSALESLKNIVPSNGTSLINLVNVLNQLDPPPDNVYLISDSLPTMGKRIGRNTTITSRNRLDLFVKAARQLPRQIPINVILFPMEGDPMASAAFWNLARLSGGSFLSPSKDWP